MTVVLRKNNLKRKEINTNILFASTVSYENNNEFNGIPAELVIPPHILAELNKALRIATIEYIRANHDSNRLHVANEWLAICEELDSLLPELQ